MIIVPISAKAQNGKDFTANILKTKLELQDKKVLIAHYGDLVKYVCKTFFNWNGEKDEFGRTLLQKVGTNIIRKQVPDYWVNFIIDILKFFPNEWDYVLIPDCRFPNEIDELIEQTNCPVYSIRVSRPNYVSTLTIEQQNHISETALDDYNNFSYFLINTTKEKVEEQVDNIIKCMKPLENSKKGDNNESNSRN